jgi:hypothetical protein
MPEDKSKWPLICQAYLLGEHLKDDNYCNAMADELAQAASTATEQSVQDLLLNDVVKRTADGSPIRDLLLDIANCRIASPLLDARLEARPGLVVAMFRRQQQRNNTRPPWFDTCEYHKHENGEPCLAVTEPSILTDMYHMFHDWRSFISTSFQGINNSFQAFRPCVSSTYTVLKKLGAKCKAAFSWCRGFLKDHL